MTASIIFDVGGPDFAGRIVTGIGTQVNMRNLDDTGVLGHQWTLLDRPISSAAVVTDPFIPATDTTGDIKGGGYLIQLITYKDVARTDVDGVARGIILIPFSGTFDWRIPAAGETTEDDPNRGWAEAMEDILRDVQANLTPGAVGGVPSVVGAGESLALESGFQYIADRKLVVNGQLIVNGLLRFINRPREPKVLPPVSSALVLPPTCLAPVAMDEGPFTLNLAPKGTSGDLVSLYGFGGPGPPTITINGSGPLIDGNVSVVMNTQGERLRLRRLLGQGWRLEI